MEQGVSGGWQGRDLGGGGLQAANRILAQRLKRRPRAYALLLLAPTGLHRAYLDAPHGAWAWRAATLAVAGLWWWQPAAGWAGVAVLAAAAIADAFWIDRRVTALNKRLRREVYLGHGATPPAGFRGRDPDAAAGRVASFAEQERLLRELAKRKPGGPPPAEG
jgi:hypothetical protein